MTLPDFALLNSGLFLLFGMIAGAWKHQKMLLSPQHQAPVYVDITHRASLMYSFVSLVVWKLAEANAYPVAFTWYAVVAPVTFFGRPWALTCTWELPIVPRINFPAGPSGPLSACIYSFSLKFAT
jgi:hypothetical protein